MECSTCGEELKVNKTGFLNDNKTNDKHPVLYCDDCNQSFTIIDGNLLYAPYYADMTHIQHECFVCGEISKFHQHIVMIMNQPPKLNSFCIDCAIEYLRNWVRKTSPNKVNEITKENIQEIASLHESTVMQKVLNKINKGIKDGK